MDMDAILTAISTVGFPIVACAVMWKQNSELQNTLSNISTAMSLLTDRLAQVEDKLDAKNSISDVLAGITERLVQIENKIEKDQ